MSPSFPRIGSPSGPLKPDTLTRDSLPSSSRATSPTQEFGSLASPANQSKKRSSRPSVSCRESSPPSDELVTGTHGGVIPRRYPYVGLVYAFSVTSGTSAITALRSILGNAVGSAVAPGTLAGAAKLAST